MERREAVVLVCLFKWNCRRCQTFCTRLSDETIANLIHYVYVNNADKEDVDVSLIYTMLFTGRRTGDFFRLKWKDIDLENQNIHWFISKQASATVLPVCDRIACFLKALKESRNKDCPWVFPNAYGRHKKEINYKHLKVLINVVGIPEGYRPTYCLRHTFFSIGIDDCLLNKRVIRLLVGHKIKKTDMVARYGHFRLNRLRNAVNVLSKTIYAIYESHYGKD